MKKKWYASKTLWINIIAIVAWLGFGLEVVDPQYEVAALAAINFILRLITKEEIIWKS